MIVQIDSPLPCAMYAGASRCEHPTTTALITPIDGGAWELLAICDAHLEESVAVSNTAPPPLTYAWRKGNAATDQNPAFPAAPFVKSAASG